MAYTDTATVVATDLSTPPIVASGSAPAPTATVTIQLGSSNGRVAIVGVPLDECAKDFALGSTLDVTFAAKASS